MVLLDRRAKKEEFRGALLSEDPYLFAKTISIPPIDTRQEKIPSINDGNDSSKLVVSGTDWKGVLSAWLSACQAAASGQARKCYENQALLHSTFNQVFASSQGNWLIPALHAVCKSTHRVALAADKESAAATGNNLDCHDKLQNAVTLLQESFSRTFNDRKELIPGAPFNEEGSKKAGVLQIVNELFSIYFQLNTLRLCKNLVRPVERLKLQDKCRTAGQIVTYRYYVGRMALFEDQYAEAESHLEFAFNNCHKDAIHNKKCILRYLIPVKLYRGRLPAATLLEKYELHEFVPLVGGIRKGDLRAFNDALVDFQDRFIRQGTYLLLEKCKTVVYRNLYKRVHYVLQRHQISLNMVAAAFKWLGVPVDLDEVECISANLIYRGHIRGYLSHAKRVLVLSKRDPFPVHSVIAK